MRVERGYSRKVLLSLLTASLTFLLISTAMAGTISGVPDHGQIKWYYCGPAALEDIFDFYGPDISQSEIADAARTDVDYSGTFTDDMRRAGHFSDLSTSQGEEMAGSITGYTGRGLGYAAFETYFGGVGGLKPLIDAGYPIVVLQYEDLVNKQWGHFRVVIGYDDGTSTIYVKDPNPNPESYSYADFEALWVYSGKWGAVVCPWQVTLSAPATVLVGATFTVTATVTYPCPSPFPTGYPASLSKATINLAAGLSLSLGETSGKTLGTGTMTAGGSETVQWNVDAVGSGGPFDITVEAEGRVSGSVSTHGSNPSYSYTDRIGGQGSTSVLTYITPAKFIESSDAGGNKKDNFVVTDDVFVYGSVYPTSEAFDLYVVNDVTTWTDGMAIPAQVPGTATTVSSDASGNIPASPVWNSPLTPGKYDIVVDVDGNGNYDAWIDALDDNDVVTTAGFLVIPQVPLGTLMASAAMIAGLVCYYAIPKVSKKK